MADRRKLGTKDMAMTMIVVLVVTLLIALYGSNISFAPGGPSGGDAPTAEVIDVFGHAQATLGIPVIVPAGVPDSWHPNSVSISDPDVVSDGVTPVGNLKAVRGGWITPDGRFIQLVEAAGDVPQTLASEFGAARQISGTVQAGGAQWQVATGARSEDAWARTVDTAGQQTTLLITGSAAEADFRTLAEALNSAD